MDLFILLNAHLHFTMRHEKKGFFEHRRIDRDEKSHYTIT